MLVKDPCWLLGETVLLTADKFLQRYARNLRAPALNWAQDDNPIFIKPRSGRKRTHGN